MAKKQKFRRFKKRFDNTKTFEFINGKIEVGNIEISIEKDGSYFNINFWNHTGNQVKKTEITHYSNGNNELKADNFSLKLSSLDMAGLLDELHEQLEIEKKALHKMFLRI